MAVPVGYLWTVALLGWGVACALTRWRWAGVLARVPALLVSELPFAVGYLLVASTALALAQGDLDSPAGLVGAGAALLTAAGLGLVVRRGLRAHAALGNPEPAHRPWGAILRAPLLPGHRGIVRVRDLAFGPALRLDVYHRRSAAVSQAVARFMGIV
jgi:hypothetical protein